MISLSPARQRELRELTRQILLSSRTAAEKQTALEELAQTEPSQGRYVITAALFDVCQELLSRNS
jgi:hypothetical protein